MRINFQGKDSKTHNFILYDNSHRNIGVEDRRLVLI